MRLACLLSRAGRGRPGFEAGVLVEQRRPGFEAGVLVEQRRPGFEAGVLVEQSCVREA